MEYKQASSQCWEELFREYGLHWSTLWRLDYLDLPRATVVDPMHNLFLGTAQWILDRAWLNSDLPKITKTQLCEIQQKVDLTPLPADMGRIPLKITSGFGLFTADL